MKFTHILLFIVVFISTSFNIINAQSENDVNQKAQDSYLVTFECESCTRKNKFSISGPENYTFKEVQFPLKQELKPGNYKMTYWQNRVQQIHLPFSIIRDSENIITVKD
jgi:hypothetical protein